MAPTLPPAPQCFRCALRNFEFRARMALACPTIKRASQSTLEVHLHNAAQCRYIRVSVEWFFGNQGALLGEHLPSETARAVRSDVCPHLGTIGEVQRFFGEMLRRSCSVLSNEALRVRGQGCLRPACHGVEPPRALDYRDYKDYKRLGAVDIHTKRPLLSARFFRGRGAIYYARQAGLLRTASKRTMDGK